MSDNVSSAGSDDQACAVEILALVIANVPLPPATSAALRLTCKDIKLAVDDSVKELLLCNDAAKRLRAVGNPLTSGLTRLLLNDSPCSTSALLNVCTMALNNSKTLKHLEIYGRVGDTSFIDTHVALGMLRTVAEWPKLEIFRICAVPRILSRYLDLENMQKLEFLRLNGFLSPGDIAALCDAQDLADRLMVLELGPCGHDEDLGEFNDFLEELLDQACNLQYLHLQMQNSRDLTFLADPELPSLVFLDLHTFHRRVKLDTTVAFSPKPYLHKLELRGRSADADTLRALLCRDGQFPSLKKLEIRVTKCNEWVFLREMDHPKLKSLKLEKCLMTLTDIGQVGAALARLSALESLKFTPKGADEEGEDEDDTNFEGASAIWTLLSTAGTLPRLRHLHLGGDFEYRDSSISCLINFADSMPNLQEIILEEASITTTSIARMVAAGTLEKWPSLKVLQVKCFESEGASFYKSVLRGVWPGLEVELPAAQAAGQE